MAKPSEFLTGAEISCLVAAAAERAAAVGMMLAPHCRHCGVWEVSGDLGAIWEYLAAAGCCTQADLEQRLEMLFAHGVGLAPCESWLNTDDPSHPPLTDDRRPDRVGRSGTGAERSQHSHARSLQLEEPDAVELLRLARPDGTPEAVLPFTVVVIQASGGWLDVSMGYIEDQDGRIRVRSLAMGPDRVEAELLAALVEAETATGDAPVPRPSSAVCSELLDAVSVIGAGLAAETAESAETVVEYPLRITPFAVAESSDSGWYLGRLAPRSDLGHPDSESTITKGAETVWHSLGPSGSGKPLADLVEAACGTLSLMVTDHRTDERAEALEVLGPAMDVTHGVAVLFRDHPETLAELATAGPEPLRDLDEVLAALGDPTRPMTADIISDRTVYALTDMAEIFNDADDEFLATFVGLLATNAAKLRITGRVIGCADPVGVLAAACRDAATVVGARTSLWRLYSAASHLVDSLDDAAGGPASIAGFETVCACIEAAGDTGDDPAAAQRRREAGYLMRLLRKAQPQPDDRYIFADPRRVARLARKVAHLSDPSARRRGYVDPYSLEVLSLARGWYQHSPTCWTLGSDPNRPRLAATATADGPARVTVLPPSNLGAGWDTGIGNLEAVVRSRGHQLGSTTIAVCCECEAGTTTVICSACGRPAGDRRNAAQSRTLEAIYELPAEAAATAAELSEEFRVWLHAHPDV